MYFDPPFGNDITVSGANISNPFAAIGGNPLGESRHPSGVGVYAPTIPFPLSGSYVTTPMANYKPMYMNQWNFSVQRQLGKDWLVTANYVGNSTIHLISGEDINPAVFLGTGPCTIQTANGPVSYTNCSTTANQQNRRLLFCRIRNRASITPASGSSTMAEPGNMRACILSANKQLSRNVTLQSNYTWSHCISDVYNQNPASTGVAPPNDRRQYRSNCIGIDLRQEFVLNFVATTPKFSNRALRMVASNWQVAPIFELKSAQEFTVFAGTDQALTTVPNQTPNLVNLNPYPANQTVNDWINKSAFATAAPGSYGNLGYNNMKGPGVVQLNLALSRTFPIHEKQALQIRAEAFNLPNHLNAFAPGVAPINAGSGANVSLTTPNFSQITNDISGNNGLLPGDYRVIQFAMKFVF